MPVRGMKKSIFCRCIPKHRLQQYRLPATMPVKGNLPARHAGQTQNTLFEKTKDHKQCCCGPTSISGSVLLYPVLFCELKPFYRSQWPFSYGSHALFYDEASSADMFFSLEPFPPFHCCGRRPPHNSLELHNRPSA